MLESSLRGVESLGGLLTVDKASLSSRHLGLVPAEEDFNLQRYDEIRKMVEERIDIDRLVQIARTAGPVEAQPGDLFPEREEIATIGVAKDSAFNFYYEDNLDILRSHGARIEFFSPMSGKVPDVDGLYFGGGYPEVFADGLAASTGVREKVRKLSDDGMSVYAECGGMMYACKTLRTLDGKDHPMTGIFDARVEMTGKLQALGYVEAKVVNDCVLFAQGRFGPGTRVPLLPRHGELGDRVRLRPEQTEGHSEEPGRFRSGTRWRPTRTCTSGHARDSPTTSSSPAPDIEGDKGTGLGNQERPGWNGDHFFDLPWEATVAIAFSTSSWFPR